jgi:single-stranded DNA-binding protein
VKDIEKTSKRRSNMNSVAIIGRVGKAPNIGNGVATFRLALGSGDKAQWFSIACFSDGALETAAKLWKGARIAITGYLRAHTFEGVSRVEIVASFIETLSRKPDGAPVAEAADMAAGQDQEETPSKPGEDDGTGAPEDDEIPF